MSNGPNKTTKMWFKIVPDKNPNADGNWEEFHVNTAAAANFKKPWDMYDDIVKRRHPNEHCVAVSRVPPAKSEMEEVAS